MMQFRKTKQDLVRILGNAAKGRFRVVDHQVQVIDSTEILGGKRRVQVFYGEGDFPKGKAGLTGPTQHEATYRIELGVSAATEVNLAVLNDADATEAQRAAALKCFKSSSKLADDSLDELFEIVYQILMDGRNIDVGSEGPPFVVKDRWIEGFSKDNPVPQGEFVELTGSVRFSCQLTEQVPGDTGTAATQPAFDITDDVNENGSNNTGSLTGQDPA
jgi:hypothetical protein